jgi:hypothetical protein
MSREMELHSVDTDGIVAFVTEGVADDDPANLALTMTLEHWVDLGKPLTIDVSVTA